MTVECGKWVEFELRSEEFKAWMIAIEILRSMPCPPDVAERDWNRMLNAIDCI